MEKLECNACLIEKDLNSFYKCKNCKDGIDKICKLCKLNGNKSKKKQEHIHPFNLEFRKSEASHFSLAGCTKEDYEKMYWILTQMGYDIEKDVHQQFLDKFNPELDKPMKYKKRTGKISIYAYDGSKKG